MKVPCQPAISFTIFEVIVVFILAHWMTIIQSFGVGSRSWKSCFGCTFREVCYWDASILVIFKRLIIPCLRGSTFSLTFDAPDEPDVVHDPTPTNSVISSARGVPSVPAGFRHIICLLHFIFKFNLLQCIAILVMEEKSMDVSSSRSRLSTAYPLDASSNFSPAPDGYSQHGHSASRYYF